MGTLLVSDVLGRVTTLLQDDYTRWPLPVLVDFLNDAHTAIARFMPSAHSRIDTIKLAAGARQSIESVDPADLIAGNGQAPSDPLRGIQLLRVVRNMGSDGATPGRPIRPVDQKALDCDPKAYSRVGDAVSTYTYDPTTPYYFSVTPAAPGKWVEVAWVAQPPKVPQDGTGTIQVADEYLDDLVNYTVARASMIDSDWANSSKAASFASLWLASMNAKVAALTGTNPNIKRLPFAPTPIGAAS